MNLIIVLNLFESFEIVSSFLTVSTGAPLGDVNGSTRIVDNPEKVLRRPLHLTPSLTSTPSQTSTPTLTPILASILTLNSY